jgi:hypothetical protein
MVNTQPLELSCATPTIQHETIIRHQFTLLICVIAFTERQLYCLHCYGSVFQGLG